MLGGKRVAAYVRCSTKEQNVGIQEREIRQFCERRGLELVTVYADEGVSGRKDSRPSLNRMLVDARKGRFDMLVIVRLDRLARSLAHLAVLAGDFQAWGVSLVATDQSFDTSTPSGMLTYGVLAAVAAFEADLVSSRTRAGLAEARANGKRFGRPPALDRKGRERVKRLRATGKSIRKISELVGVSVGTVHAAAQS